MYVDVQGKCRLSTRGSKFSFCPEEIKTRRLVVKVQKSRRLDCGVSSSSRCIYRKQTARSYSSKSNGACQKEVGAAPFSYGQGWP